VAVGASSDASFTLTNVGGATAGTPAIAITGADAAELASTSDCTTALAPGDACTIWVRYTPSGVHASAATLGGTASPGGSASADLSGAGVRGLAISPPSFAFGDVAVANQTPVQTFTVRNTGSADIADLAVTGDAGFVTPVGAGDWCGTTLGVGRSCQISVAF